jgi:hypothetical protein
MTIPRRRVRSTSKYRNQANAAAGQGRAIPHATAAVLGAAPRHSGGRWTRAPCRNVRGSWGLATARRSQPTSLARSVRFRWRMPHRLADAKSDVSEPLFHVPLTRLSLRVRTSGYGQSARWRNPSDFRSRWHEVIAEQVVKRVGNRLESALMRRAQYRAMDLQAEA